MAAAAGIWGHAAHGASLPGATAMDSTTGSTSSSSSSDSATISANDFLTLLVTEMQNQDPTADTDPNEYINQLVNVNSLEQLININQTLTTDLGGSASTTPASGTNTGTPSQPSSGSNGSTPAAPGVQSPVGPVTQSLVQPGLPAAHSVSGNLGIPQTNPSAQRVAQSLSGQ